MPENAPAAPLPGQAIPASRGGTQLRREYRDVLDRPMRGTVTITPAAGPPVTVQLADGVLVCDLPPGAYSLTASLRTADGVRAYKSETVNHS